MADMSNEISFEKKESKGEVKSRKEILTASFELINEIPYDKLTMQKIAEQAGVSKSLLFYQFGSKRELVKKSLIFGFEQMMEFFQPMLEAGKENIPDLVKQGIETSSTANINMFQTYMEVANMNDPGDELTYALRKFYGQFIGNIGSMLDDQGVCHPMEKATLLTLMIDTFGLLEMILGRKHLITR